MAVKGRFEKPGSFLCASVGESADEESSLPLFDPPSELLAAVRGCSRPFLCTHIYPDGDALGSTVALAHALRSFGADPALLLTHPVPEKLHGADRDRISAVIPGEPTAEQVERIAAADRIFILDTS